MTPPQGKGGGAATSVRRGGRRNRRPELIDAAIAVFYEKGYASASIEDIAGAIGVRKGSVYHYIDSKEDLLARIFEQSDEQSFGLMQEIGALDLPATEQLYAFARTWTLWYMANIERAAVYLRDWKHLTGPRRDKVRAVRREYLDRVEAMVEDVKREGKADPALDTKFAGFFLFSVINGLVSWYRRDGPDSSVAIAEAYAEMIVGTIVGTRVGPGA
ncbi:MAG: TetR family transcriptional regulator [Actinobacteria bacterium]|nr:TetR family transcriptional regulator [Actinomycetota bacterium]